MKIPTQSFLVGAAILVVPLSFLVGNSAIADDQKCERDDTVLEKSLQGHDTLENGEVIKWESRVEKPAADVWRFLYCVENERKYRQITAIWKGPDGRIYFQGKVPPRSERSSSRDSVIPGYSADAKGLDIDDRHFDPETVAAPTKPVSIPKKTTLRSTATVDVPVDPKVAYMIQVKQYDVWNSRDFVTLRMDFLSTAETIESGEMQVSNTFQAAVIGDATYSNQLLNNFPLTLEVSESTTSSQDFWGTTRSLAINRLFTSEKLASSYLTTRDSIREHAAVINVKFGNEVYASFPVSYLSP